MRYRTLGQSGLLVSQLGFGTMRLPISKKNPHFGEAISLIQYAIEKGINFFDVGTFYCHGYCEEVFGKATQSIPREKLIISGKNSAHQSNSDQWLGQLKNSLRLFQRECFDLYFLHYLNYVEWTNYFIGNKVVDQIDEARKSGLIRHLAFSSHDSPDNVRKLFDTGIFDVIMLPYNIINRKYESVLRYAYDNGLGVVIMSALAGKALADNKLSLLTIEEHGNESTSTKAIALNYVFSQPFIHSVFLGMDTIDAIVEAVDTLHHRRYLPAELEEISNLVDEEKVRLSIPCTECNYCMPCIQGIDIPGVIDLVNQYCILKLERTFSRDYAMLQIPAECCIGCDSCKDKCPNGINIPEIMEKAVKTFLVG